MNEWTTACSTSERRENKRFEVCRIRQIEILINKVKWPVFVQFSLSYYSFVLLFCRGFYSEEINWKTKCKVSIFSAGTWSTQMVARSSQVQPNPRNFSSKSRFYLPYSNEKKSESLFFIVLCRIQCTDEHHTILLRDILAIETFKYKPRTQQRSNLWNSIFDHLNDSDCSPAWLGIFLCSNLGQTP